MELLAKAGQHRAALAQFERCSRILFEELGIEPGSATRALYERLLRSQSVQADGAERHAAISGMPLVGRRREVRQLHSILRTVAQIGSHMVCIAGEAGIGKTRVCDELLHIAQREDCTRRARVPMLCRVGLLMGRSPLGCGRGTSALTAQSRHCPVVGSVQTTAGTADPTSRNSPSWATTWRLATQTSI